MAANAKFHELIEAIANCTNLVGRRSKLDNLEKLIEKHEKRGWDKNTDIPDATPANQYPLIHWAAILGKYQALKWLLEPENGFSFDVRSSGYGETALHSALDLPSLQPKSRRCSTDNQIKMFSQTVALLKKLLPVKDEVNGNSPLHRAVKTLLHGDHDCAFYLGCVKVIIEKCKEMENSELEAVVNSTNNYGETALHILARAPKDKVEYCTKAIQMLITAGAKTDIRNDKRRTAFDIAASFQNEPIMEELLKNTPVEDKDDAVSDNLPVAEDIDVPEHSSQSVDQPSPIGQPHLETSAVISTLENEEEVEDKDDAVSDNPPVEEDIIVLEHSSDSVDQPSPIGHPHSKTSAVVSTLENKEKVEDKDDVIVVSDNLPVEEDIIVPKHSSDSVDQPSLIGHPHSKTSAVVSTLGNKEKLDRVQQLQEQKASSSASETSPSGPTALYSEALRLLTEARRVDEKNLEKIRTQAEAIDVEINSEEKEIERLKKEMSSKELNVVSLKRKQQEYQSQCEEIQKRLKTWRMESAPTDSVTASHSNKQ